MSTKPAPYPVLTDGVTLYTTTDGVNFVAIGTGALATQSAAGLMSAEQFSNLNALVLAYTPVVDFTVANATLSLSPPLKRSGYIFVCQRANLTIKTMAGTATSALTIKVGNDAAQTNVISSFSQAASTLNAIVGSTPLVVAATSATTTPSDPLLDAAAEITANSTAVTGATACSGYLTVLGNWLPL